MITVIVDDVFGSLDHSTRALAGNRLRGERPLHTSRLQAFF